MAHLVGRSVEQLAQGGNEGLGPGPRDISVQGPLHGQPATNLLGLALQLSEHLRVDGEVPDLGCEPDQVLALAFQLGEAPLVRIRRDRVECDAHRLLGNVCHVLRDEDLLLDRSQNPEPSSR